MNKESDLSQRRVAAETRPFVLDSLPTIEQQKLGLIGEQLKAVVVGYNFDTFSFLFELIQKTKDEKITLSDAFVALKIDSITLAQKYTGTNCTGLSMLLQRNLKESGVDTTLIPAYGNYLITEEADRYAQIRTTDLLGLRRKESEGETVFLAPGLIIDKPIFVREGYQVESYDNQYIVTRVGKKGFEIATIRPGGDIVRRDFHFEGVLNPNESFQKNLLRVRTRYQITRWYEDGRRDFITFDFPKRMFRVFIGNKEVTFDVASFRSYVLANSQLLNDIFRNPYLDAGFLMFVDNIDTIKNELLLPEIQSILSQAWKFS